jgi:hypothetical protein
MLRSLTEPKGYILSATDGEIGRYYDFLFDDARWTVRYMVADTGRWLPGRKILVSPPLLEQPDWDRRRFPVRLSRQQIEEGPSLDTDAPVSRRYERAYHDFFATPYYWMGNGLWGNFPYPQAVMPPAPEPQPRLAEEAPPAERPDGTHLRSVREVTGYEVMPEGSHAGKVSDFIVDDTSWALHFVVVDRSILPFSKKVLIATPWIEDVSWVDQEIHVDVSEEQIAGAPVFDAHNPLDDAYVSALYAHYGRPRG